MKTIIFRPQRGGLKESMLECVTLPASVAAIASHLQASIDSLKVEPYAKDERIGWDTYLVTVDGKAVGFTNGPLEYSPE